MMRLQLVVPFLLIAIILGASWSLFSPYFFHTHDYVHGARIVEMATALRDGHLPPRWSENFGYGYGMPLFQFYAPLPYFIGSLFYLAGVPLVISVKMLFLLPTLLIALSAYQLGKSLYNSSSGLILSALLTLAPYRAVNLFVRGAVSEAWGQLGMVIATWGVLATLQKKPLGPLILFSGFLLLSLSHNLSLLMFAILFIPLCILLLCFVAAQNGAFLFQSKQSFFTFLRQRMFAISASVVAVVGSLLSASFYLIPMFAEKSFTHVASAVTSGFFHYQFHFLYIRQFFQPNWEYGGSILGPEDDISFFLGYMQLAGLFFSVVLLLQSTLRFFQRRSLKKDIGHFISLHQMLSAGIMLLLGFTLFLTLFKAKPIWDAIPFFSYIQFPWRFLSISSLLVAIVGALATQRIPLRLQVVVSICVVFFTLATNYFYFQPKAFEKDVSGWYYEDPKLIQSTMSGILYDYMPLGIPIDSSPPIANLFCSGESLPTLIACDEIEVISEGVQEKSYVVTVAEPTTVSFAIAHFPGWITFLDDVVQQNLVTNGLVSVQVPAGTSTVTAKLENSQVRAIADLISGVAFLLSLLGLYFYQNRAQSHAAK